MESWDHLRSFLAVLEEGSLSGAARRLRLTQPTVGRHVEALERALGRLFTRSAGGLAPTEAAVALRPHAQAMAVAAEALARTASGEADVVKGAIRLTAAHIIGVEVLPPIVTRFHESWPLTSIELSLSSRTEDLLRREADIAVRMTRPTQGAVVARRIGRLRLGLYAHRSYLQAHGEPRTLKEAGHAAIGFDRNVEVARQLGETRFSRNDFAFRADEDLAQLAALRSGFGIGACHVPLARRDPNLVPVLEGEFDHGFEVWVAMHEDLKTTRRMRLMFDALAEGLGEYLQDGG